MNRFFKVVLALLCIASLVSAQSTRPYSKKVVSFVNKVLAPSQASLSMKQTDYIGESVGQGMNLPRFNFAPLPDKYVAPFRDEASGWTDVTPDKIKAGIDKFLAPQLLDLIDQNKEAFSKQNLTDADRNSFLATKAKAAGLSASQLEAILNSGFFFVPFLESYTHKAEQKVREVKNDKGEVTRRVKYTEYTHEMQLGVLWYQLKIDKENKASVVYVGPAKGWNSSSISRSTSQDEGEEGNADWDAFTGAVDVSCKNIALETKNMEPFQLVGGVTETTGMGMMLSVGSREGVHLDDTYWIEEMEENDQGQIQKSRRGFVKIREVGNNKDDASALSYAQTITGTNYSPGLSATELPLIGVNVLIAGAMMPVKISPYNNFSRNKALINDNDLLASSETYHFHMNVMEETKYAAGAMVAIQTSLAHATHISELWFHIGAQGGVITPTGQIIYKHFTSNGWDKVSYDSSDIGASLTGSINVGLEKKFYIKRFGIFLQVDGKYELLRLNATGKDNTNANDVKYKLTNSSFGADFRAGIETYLSPKVSIGFAAEYNLFGASEAWNVKVTDKDDVEIVKNDGKGPEVNFGGLGIYAWINLAIPSFN